ncbi:MAG TPA: 4Fe-4S dicluster domain-containing protein [Candidatus Limnocylindria bacterium]|nr:4Fe-4S dicluster domain-containing protein [Candidatus Limnocylindria bacterium]
MRYGFVIDQRLCIGCHACTVACKEENQVPLGAFRTWVKYVEKGVFPETRRYFSVLRCNHCDDAPCVTICPTVALYRRDDGIVDFDGDRCIGCKSCMQGCPYDALYIDPNTQTAAKCNYCAHRIEVGLEPACVIVCPETAIIAGDLDDPASKIARLVAREQVEVRKAEQGTRPKVYYVGAESSSLTPQMQRPTPTHMWGQRPPAETDLIRMVAAMQAKEGNGDGALSRTVYDAPHAPLPWGAKVSAYLWTKSISAGALMVAAVGTLLGVPAGDFLVGVAAPLIALLFLAITTGLLVADLKRPDRFHYILFKGNRTSWLVWGAWILIAYGGVAAAWLVGGLTGNDALLRALALPALALGAGAAGYSAFLFGQAEGRDFWQSPLLLPQLLVSALAAGAAALLIAGSVPAPDPRAIGGLAMLLLLALLAQALVLFAELFGSHASVDVARAARLITRGPWSGRFWGGVIVLGILVPLALVAWGPGPAVLGALFALLGLWIYEDLWVKAGQSIPLS